MVFTRNRGGTGGRRGLEWMMVLERLSARETPGWRGKPSGGGKEPGRGIKIHCQQFTNTDKFGLDV